MMTTLSIAEPQELQALIAAEPDPQLLPGVYRQPPLKRLQRGHLDLELTLRQWLRARLRKNATLLHHAQQALEGEFAPLLNWALASWDYVLTTEGCRFLLRKDGEHWGMRGDYRACLASDYHRLVIHTFRHCVETFAHQPQHSLPMYLAETFWPRVRATYQNLSQPPDPRQRLLTGYSYLRCVPYQFLNDYHHVLVSRVVQALPTVERRTIELYFLRFFTDEATARAQEVALATCQTYKLRALHRLAQTNSLACALLLQIERY